MALLLFTAIGTVAATEPDSTNLQIIEPGAKSDQFSASANALAPLHDKTLVVWVAPADLTQRGGSALTLDDFDSHFDGIIFGELTARRWMPGSDFHRRTLPSQTQWPEETADAKSFVQIAITYRDREVTIFRNGQSFARYTTANPAQEFGPQSVVLIGMRHLDQNDEAHFAGVIDDARIYDRALSPEQIAALKPNELSDPKPWAWWTFDNPKAEERMGRFLAIKLVGGAKLEDGKLFLDGETGSLFAAATADDLACVAPAVTPLISATDISASRHVREQLLADPYRAAYHFVIPEGQAMPFDPNGAIYWKGRYHLFYIFQDERGHNWGHVSSTDLFHWRHHPTGLISGMFSGNCFINKEGRPTMCYHQVGQGNAMAVAVDDELNQWRKLDSNPITPKTQPGDPFHDKYRSWDPFGWVENGNYYAIFGGERPAIAKAPSLAGEWKYVGDLMANAVSGVSINEDVSCADFFQLGNRRMLLCISHRLGCRYYLGDWEDEQFHPTFHEKMSWVDNSFFAPESLLDEKGRRIMWAWIFDGPGFKKRASFGWSGTMSLPRVLSLSAEGALLMNPPVEIESLRYNGKQKASLDLKADTDMKLEEISGHCLEVDLTMTAASAQQFGLKVCCSPAGEEQTVIYYDAAEKMLKVDTRKSSLRTGPKSIEAGPLALKSDEPLQLRVFVDKSVVEVFANGRQAVMRRIYPSRRDSVGLALFTRGGPAHISKLAAWEMAPSNPY